MAPLRSIVLLSLVLLTVAHPLSSAPIKLPSGHIVPYADFLAHPFADISSSPPSQLFELLANHLHGPAFHVDLSVGITRPQSPYASLHISLNGRPAPRSLAAATVREVAGLVVVHATNGHVVSVTGRGLHLVPLHRARHPHVLINARSARVARTVHLHADLRPHPREGRSDDEPVLDEVFIKPTPRPFLDTTARQAAMTCASGTIHFLEVAVAFDNSLCALYNNDIAEVSAAVQAIVDASSAAFAKNMCVRLAMTHLDAHCQDPNDPYSPLGDFSTCTGSCSTDQIFYGFRDMWRADYSGVRRDAAYLITGFSDQTSTAGLAYVGASCSNKWGYGWIEGPREHVFAHEVGHTLNSSHSTEGLMKPYLDLSAPLEFSAVTAQAITDFVDSTDFNAQCITTDAPVCDETCSGMCIDGKCVGESARPSPSPMEQEPSLSPRPSEDQIPSRTPELSMTPKLSMSPKPTMTPEPSKMPSPSMTPKPSELPEPSKTPKPSEEPMPSRSSKPSEQPEPSNTPKPSEEPMPSRSPKPSYQPEPTQTATPSEEPMPSRSPKPSEKPEPSRTPKPSMKPFPSMSMNPKPSVSPTFTSPPICVATLLRSQALRCLPLRRVGRLQKKGVGAVIAKVAVEHGELKLQLSAGRRVTMNFAAAGVAFVGMPTFSAQRGGGETVWFSLPLVDLPVENGKCCGVKVKIIVQVGICRKEKCEVVTKTFEKKVRCVRPCRRKTGTVVMMSENVKCPYCKM